MSSLVYSKPWGSLDAKDSEWDRLDSTGDEANVSNVCRLFRRCGRDILFNILLTVNLVYSRWNNIIDKQAFKDAISGN